MKQRYHWIAPALALFPLVCLTAADGPGLFHLFVTSDRCIGCHNALSAPQGEDISIGVDWRSSMMANAARDPYWQAAVRREILVHPTAKAIIENECSACHMPMMRYEAKAAGRMGGVFAHLPVYRAIEADSQLAIDGVSCSVCHQIRPDNFGERESFTAGFLVDSKTPFGDRSIFGPFEIDEGRKALMKSSSWFQPAQADHIRESELCATCHTLFTHALDDKGEIVGELPEQVPYLEWKHSAFSRSRSCQSCHMIKVEGEVPISKVLGEPREDVSRHVFRGGNFFMPRILNRYREELGISALPQELETTSRRAVEHLAGSTARMNIDSLEVREDRLEVRLSVENLAGHKLPTAYPSRRVWIHFTVQDGQDRVVFDSGRLKPDGSISGNDNDLDGGSFEPHYDRIENPDQVQIYEAILAGPDSRLTTVLLTAARYVKDNRVIPDGFDKATAEDDISVKGSAEADEDFLGGGDSLVYRVDIGNSRGPFRIRAQLWYQPIGFRWAHNLALEEAEEIDRFVSYYRAMAKSSATLLASAEKIFE